MSRRPETTSEKPDEHYYGYIPSATGQYTCSLTDEGGTREVVFDVADSVESWGGKRVTTCLACKKQWESEWERVNDLIVCGESHCQRARKGGGAHTDAAVAAMAA